MVVPPQPVGMGMMHDTTILTDMQSKDPSVLAVSDGFTFTHVSHPVNGMTYVGGIPLYSPHVPNQNFHVMSQPIVPIESHLNQTPEEEKNVTVTDESKSDGASTPDGQIGSEGSNRRGGYRGRGRPYRGNKNYRSKMGFFNPKGSNDEINENPEARGPEEYREVKRRHNKPRPARNVEQVNPQNEQARPAPRQEGQKSPMPPK